MGVRPGARDLPIVARPNVAANSNQSALGKRHRFANAVLNQLAAMDIVAGFCRNS